MLIFKSKKITLMIIIIKNCKYWYSVKVVFNSQWLVDFVFGLVNSVFILPDGQVMFFEEFE